MIKIKYFLDKISSLEESIKRDITGMTTSEFILHIDKDKNMGDEINKLLKDIEKKIPRTFGSSIPYILGELTDNIEQHSNYFKAYAFLKQHTKEGIIEVLIFDDGLTIPFVFKKNKIKFSTSGEAIKLALEGTTTKKEAIPRGFGLRTSKEIVKALEGSMKIISGRGFLELQDSAINCQDLKKEFKGTLIHIKLKTPEKDLNIYSYLE